jgi:hypothetical protein
MISRHHSERVHPANSGRLNTSSIRAASASETLSPIGTRPESTSLAGAMSSRYPERARLERARWQPSRPGDNRRESLLRAGEVVASEAGYYCCGECRSIQHPRYGCMFGSRMRSIAERPQSIEDGAAKGRREVSVARPTC